MKHVYVLFTVVQLLFMIQDVMGFSTGSAGVYRRRLNFGDVSHVRRDTLSTFSTREIVEELEVRLQRRARTSSSAPHKTGSSSSGTHGASQGPSHGSTSQPTHSSSSSSSTHSEPSETKPTKPTKPTSTHEIPDDEPESSGGGDGSPLISFNFDNNSDSDSSDVVTDTTNSTNSGPTFDASFDSPFFDSSFSV
ncbi:hypothetical protein BJ165DRAFT_132566 [Panaeolus papilionaceus]|nr:hypothetical protein BJ165DRAFT_132566 [Panaeolus papilionaceus]